MREDLRVMWRTVQALLVAVATALMFSTTTPAVPPASGDGETFCVPELHDTPFISKQESSESNAPRGETHALADPRVDGLAYLELQALGIGSFLALHITPRGRPAGGIYPRGPPL